MVKNAQITKTSLGKEDHGIMTCWLHLTYGAAGQGFGGYYLGSYGKRPNKKTGYGIEAISRIIDVVGVANWEDLKGKYIRVRFTDKPSGFGHEIDAIGHIIEDKWFSFKEFAKELPDEN